MLKPHNTMMGAKRFAARETRRHEEMPHINRPYRYNTVHEDRNWEDEREPTEDEQIKVHYFKHQPWWEFRNQDVHHVDPYRHWLHNRIDYYGTESCPGDVSPWERGLKRNHLIHLAILVGGFWFWPREYVSLLF